MRCGHIERNYPTSISKQLLGVQKYTFICDSNHKAKYKILNDSSSLHARLSPQDITRSLATTFSHLLSFGKYIRIPRCSADTKLRSFRRISLLLQNSYDPFNHYNMLFSCNGFLISYAKAHATVLLENHESESRNKVSAYP